MLVMLLGIIVFALLLMWGLSYLVLNQHLGSISRAVILDDLGEYPVLYDNGGLLRLQRLYQEGAHEHDHALRVLDANGEVLLEVNSPETKGIHWPDYPWLPSHEIDWHSLPLPSGKGSALVGRRGLSDGHQLWLARTDTDEIAILHDLQRKLLLAGLLTALTTIVPLVWFTRHVLNPVRSFIASAKILTREHRLDQRLSVDGGIPELREFAGTLNESLDRVEILTQELEAANDQLAHELRTPLARIRGNVEVVLAHCDDPIGHEAAALSIEEIERSTALIQSILSVRAGDARSMKLYLEPTSLRDLLTGICELFTAAAEQRGQELELLITGDTAVMVDRQRLQQAVSNLLDNALAYSPIESTITVLLDVEDDFATIHVLDQGPGISETDPQRIWRRFMRGSAASATTPGIGLGLSLVKAVAHVHRGEAGVQNRPEGGADFWIKLPVGLHN